MYRVLGTNGDSVQVPRLVFTRLTGHCDNDARFRVALYMVASGEADAAAVAKELCITVAQADSALQYWEGAGLLQKQEAEAGVPYKPASRRRMTTREVTSAGANDAVLAGLLGEIQRIFGGIVSQSDLNIFSTLYLTDGIPADMILLAASHFASQGKASARYIEKTLLSWRRDGITDCAAADRYLQLLAQRQARDKEIAALMGHSADGFTVAERKRIAKWFEEYEYDSEMITTARLVAGDKRNDVRYLDGILRKWFAKGYRTPRDVQAAEEGANLQVTSERAIAPEDDLLLNYAYAPNVAGKGAAE